MLILRSARFTGVPQRLRQACRWQAFPRLSLYLQRRRAMSCLDIQEMPVLINLRRVLFGSHKRDGRMSWLRRLRFPPGCLPTMAHWCRSAGTPWILSPATRLSDSCR
jgi:hypothetical protein